MGQRLTPSKVELNMLKIVMLVAAVSLLSVGASAPANAEGGCYRIGETGYHYYNFCLGPWFFYAHKKECSKGGHCLLK